EVILNFAMKRPVSIGDGNAAAIGLLLAMLLPATAPWWFVLVGTFLAIVVGKMIYGGIGGNSFNPVVVAIAILGLSWNSILDFSEAYINYDFSFSMFYPLAALKAFGVSAVSGLSAGDLMMGKQIGGIGATFGLGLIIGGIYLIIRGFIRWEIAVSFLVGVFVTALLFNMADSSKYAGAVFHLLSGYTLIGAFFLATEDSSSPVNLVPMMLYGLLAGLMTVLIRNIGAYVDGVIYAILVANLLSPVLDKIRPKAIGKVA
ncbi:MAG: RnfABCDGE type electron transport complex subunit D, partial [Desulfobacterales bacterium]|nr:RnfABCDGE type electron transport complex subunit D [Desulfobacterales bacterium]